MLRWHFMKWYSTASWQTFPKGPKPHQLSNSMFRWWWWFTSHLLSFFTIIYSAWNPCSWSGRNDFFDRLSLPVSSPIISSSSSSLATQLSEVTPLSQGNLNHKNIDSQDSFVRWQITANEIYSFPNNPSYDVDLSDQPLICFVYLSATDRHQCHVSLSQIRDWGGRGGGVVERDIEGRSEAAHGPSFIEESNNQY